MQAVGSWGLSPHWALVRPVQLGKDRDTRTRTRARPLGHTFPNTPSCAPNPQPQQSIIPSSPKQNKSCTAAFPDAPASCSPCPGTGATSSGRTVELPGRGWGEGPQATSRTPRSQGCQGPVPAMACILCVTLLKSLALSGLPFLLSEWVWHPSPAPGLSPSHSHPRYHFSPHFGSHSWERSPQWQGLCGL